MTSPCSPLLHVAVDFVRRVTTNETLEDIYSDERKRIWNTFPPDIQKRVHESCVFVRFAAAAALMPNPYDHANRNPPLPDIQVNFGGHPYYFELAEITDEGLAKVVSISEKAAKITGVAFSQLDPLLRTLWGKCQKPHYETNGASVDLLLYYSKQYPYEPLLYDILGRNSTQRLVASSQYRRLWVFSDWPPRKVLWQSNR